MNADPYAFLYNILALKEGLEPRLSLLYEWRPPVFTADCDHPLKNIRIIHTSKKTYLAFSIRLEPPYYVASVKTKLLKIIVL